MFSNPTNDQTKKKIYNRTTQKKQKKGGDFDQTIKHITVDEIANSSLK